MEQAPMWQEWARQLPALGMVLLFLWFAGRAVISALNSISQNCHDTQREGHKVISSANTCMGQVLESNQETRAIMAEVKTLLIRKNGGGR